MHLCWLDFSPIFRILVPLPRKLWLPSLFLLLFTNHSTIVVFKSCSQTSSPLSFYFSCTRNGCPQLPFSPIFLKGLVASFSAWCGVVWVGIFSVLEIWLLPTLACRLSHSLRSARRRHDAATERTIDFPHKSHHLLLQIRWPYLDKGQCKQSHIQILLPRVFSGIFQVFPGILGDG